MMPKLFLAYNPQYKQYTTDKSANVLLKLKSTSEGISKDDVELQKDEGLLYQYEPENHDLDKSEGDNLHSFDCFLFKMFCFSNADNSLFSNLGIESHQYQQNIIDAESAAIMFC